MPPRYRQSTRTEALGPEGVQVHSNAEVSRVFLFHLDHRVCEDCNARLKVPAFDEAPRCVFENLCRAERRIGQGDDEADARPRMSHARF